MTINRIIRCLIYVRISLDKLHDAHGVANQLGVVVARERAALAAIRKSVGHGVERDALGRAGGREQEDGEERAQDAAK